ncbi:MAG: nicotinate-nucleotide adenylyltransferase [Desulfobacteraceae bacterium]|nr:nicotinate-nucleotide adenylyltransferase [Desulfobacteraceae bacterium]
MTRIGLFGGTFNPVHQGHLLAADSVRDAFGLSSVILIPAAVPPHKASSELAEAQDRRRLLELAVRGHKGLEVCPIELNRSGPSYTIDTVRELQRHRFRSVEMMFIVGADAFLEIDTWKSFSELLRLVPFIVISRPEKRLASEGSLQDAVDRFLRSRVSKRCQYEAGRNRFFCPGMQFVYPYAFSALDVSATQIRNRIRKGRSLSGLVPPLVEACIREKGLYR